MVFGNWGCAASAQPLDAVIGFAWRSCLRLGIITRMKNSLDLVGITTQYAARAFYYKSSYINIRNSRWRKVLGRSSFKLANQSQRALTVIQSEETELMKPNHGIY